MVPRSAVANRLVGSLGLACALWLCSAGTIIAQTVLVFLPPPPPVPFGPTELALAGAYGSINRAAPVDPSAALRAAFAYEAALARLRMGDTFGARAEAARAQAIAGWAGPGTSIPLAVPVQVAASPLPGYILDARNRIWQAQDRGIDTHDATRYLRVAVDAYLDGNTPRAQSEARAAIASLPAR
jgi:hypothetical protein